MGIQSGAALLHPRAKDFNRKGRKGDAKDAEKSFVLMVVLRKTCAVFASFALPSRPLRLNAFLTSCS